MSSLDGVKSRKRSQFCVDDTFNVSFVSPVVAKSPPKETTLTHPICRFKPGGKKEESETDKVQGDLSRVRPHDGGSRPQNESGVSLGNDRFHFARVKWLWVKVQYEVGSFFCKRGRVGMGSVARVAG